MTDKRLAIELMLSTGKDVYVHFDPRRQGVIVPPWLTHQPSMCLSVGLNMPIHIPDLVTDEYGITGTLSFSRTPFKCTIPYSAIYAVDRGGPSDPSMVWERDMPAEVVNKLIEAKAAKARSVISSFRLGSPIIKRKTKVPYLFVIDGGKRRTKGRDGGGGGDNHDFVA